jgi:hypothetical protein
LGSRNSYPAAWSCGGAKHRPAIFPATFMHAVAFQTSHSPCSLPLLPWAAWTSVATLGYDRPRDSKQENLQLQRHATASPERAVAQTQGQRTLPTIARAPWPRCWMTAPFLLEFRGALAVFENERRASCARRGAAVSSRFFCTRGARLARPLKGFFPRAASLKFSNNLVFRRKREGVISLCDVSTQNYEHGGSMARWLKRFA